MKTSNFENRVSLTQKNKRLSGVINEIASNYGKRESFCKQLNTTEICTNLFGSPVATCVVAVGFIFTVGIVLTVWLGAGASNYAACHSEVLPCNDYAMVNSSLYKNIV
jgi:hypothetical protein